MTPAPKVQDTPRWTVGVPQQHGLYMTTLALANGARTTAPVSYHSGKFYAWYAADAAILSSGAKIIAYFSIPPAFEGGAV